MTFPSRATARQRQCVCPSIVMQTLSRCQMSLTRSSRGPRLRLDFQAPAPIRFKGDRYTSFGQRILDVMEARTESLVRPDGVADDLRLESMAVLSA